MTFAVFQQAVAWGGAFAILAVGLVLVAREGWRAVWKRGRGFAAVLLIGAAVATINAQKPPVVKGMNLRITNVTAKGFDCSWDYGGLTPADFTDGETVKLTAQITGLDYTLLLGTLPPTVTNYHVNAVARGFPKDWMRYDVKVTARLSNADLMGEAERDGDDNIGKNVYSNAGWLTLMPPLEVGATNVFGEVWSGTEWVTNTTVEVSK